MNKTEMINRLAHEATTEVTAFTALFTTIQPQFKAIIDSYMIRNNLTGFNFDKSDYESAVGQATWEALRGYDITKGDFMRRLVLFARKRMSDITDYNLAAKRYDKTKQSVSFDQLFEAEEFDLEDTNEELNDTEKLISDFIATDRDGIVVKILTSTSDSKLRKEAFIIHFGKYEATERKRVQRVRERLLAHLISNGVFI